MLRQIEEAVRLDPSVLSSTETAHGFRALTLVEHAAIHLRYVRIHGNISLTVNCRFVFLWLTLCSSDLVNLLVGVGGSVGTGMRTAYDRLSRTRTALI